MDSPELSDAIVVSNYLVIKLGFKLSSESETMHRLFLILLYLTKTCLRELRWLPWERSQFWAKLWFLFLFFWLIGNLNYWRNIKSTYRNLKYQKAAFFSSNKNFHFLSTILLLFLDLVSWNFGPKLYITWTKFCFVLQHQPNK